MTALAILKEARTLIDEKGWTQRASARDPYGNNVGATNRHAVCFCSLGALHRAAVELHGPSADMAEIKHAIDRLQRSLPQGFTAVSLWNDRSERTKAEVLAVFDKAIASAEKETVQ